MLGFLANLQLAPGDGNFSNTNRVNFDYWRCFANVPLAHIPRPVGNSSFTFYERISIHVRFL